jgi:hypothetical protein
MAAIFFKFITISHLSNCVKNRINYIPKDPLLPSKNIPTKSLKWVIEKATN